MKYIVSLAFTLILLSSCQRSPVDRLFSKYKSEDNSFAATLPGWLIEKGISAAFDENDDAQLASFESVVTNIKKIRVLVGKDPQTNKQEIRNMNDALTKAKYELYGMVNSKGTNLNFWVKEKKERIRDVFLFINGDDKVVLLQVKGDIDMAALEKIDLNNI